VSDVNRAGLDETLQMVARNGNAGNGARLMAKGYTLDVSSSRGRVCTCRGSEARFRHRALRLQQCRRRTSSARSPTRPVEEYEWQLGINLWGVLYGTKAFLPMMLAQREGCVVNISSVFGLLGYPMQSAYNMSKFAVRGLTECLWSELEGTGVRAVCVHPGGIKTKLDKVPGT
jgi:NAD(P)-dependent dehydrogenase (short-subunit alcohol dehydrogenase family)